MRITVEATDQELAERADVLLAHVRDLQADARARVGDPVTKAARLQIKAHPVLAMTQLRRRWVAGYRKQMAAMNAEIAAYLDQLTRDPVDGSMPPRPPERP